MARLFFNGALRRHAARRAHVANVRETVCYRSAFFWFHRLMTAGTLNDRRKLLVVSDNYNLFSPRDNPKCILRRNLTGLTPAMAPGIPDKLWSVEDIVALVEASEPKPGKRGPYKKRAA